MSARLRVYELYGSRTFPSTRTADYRGYLARVAAVNVRQAYALLARRAWAKGPDAPRGILEECPGKGEPFRRWDGTTHHGGTFRHGQGKRAIRQAMEREVAA